MRWELLSSRTVEAKFPCFSTLTSNKRSSEGVFIARAPVYLLVAMYVSVLRHVHHHDDQFAHACAHERAASRVTAARCLATRKT